MKTDYLTEVRERARATVAVEEMRVGVLLSVARSEAKARAIATGENVPFKPIAAAVCASYTDAWRLANRADAFLAAYPEAKRRLIRGAVQHSPAFKRAVLGWKGPRA